MNCAAIERLLIANRGEIAIRIARAAADLGLSTVALYAEDDARALHVRRADRAWALRGSGAATYLDMEQIIAAARETGCRAVHPGYGFLAENAEFAERCAHAGLIFVGPSPQALALFGDKTAARRLAAEHGVPVLPGTQGPTSLDEARQFLRSLAPGGAIMIKAVAGGGGRGMRVLEGADAAQRLEETYARCRSEARAAFGIDTVYVEQLIASARHIEIQVVGDGSGSVVALGERECTLQRRHQKLVEIAPCPGLAPFLRRQLIDDALRMAASTRYSGLGTFEFLVDADQPDRYAFIEANPRLQVEHTVTEAVTGLDLVQTQLRIAAGATLADLHLTPAELPVLRGLAVQLRVNMEALDVHGQSLPAGGTLTSFELPSGPGIRVDTFGYTGYTTTPNYDSLLAKLIVHVPDAHGEAGLAALLDKAYRALCECRIEGVSTNLGLLQALVRHPAVRTDRISTRFVEAHGPELAAAATAAHPQRWFEVESSAAPTGADAMPAQEADDDSVPVISPLQGRVVRVEVAESDRVRAGRTLAVVEAMKMEHQVTAPCNGMVTRLLVEPGQGIAAGALLMQLTAGDAAADPEGAGAAADTSAIDAGSRALLDRLLQRQTGLLDAQRPDAVQRARKRGVMTARERIDALCEPGSFHEIGGLVRPLDVDREAPGDGVVIGTARIDGRPVVVLSQDFSVFGGSVGHLGARKKERATAIARHHGLPMVMLLDGGGHRIQDGQNSRDYADAGPMLRDLARLSGWVPVVACMLGAGFAANTNSAGLADFVVMVRGQSTMGLAGPALVKAGTGEVIGAEALGGAAMQVDTTGLADLGVEDEAAALQAVRRFLSYLPANARTDVPLLPVPPPDEARAQALLDIVPANTRRVYDVRRVVELIADAGSLFEIKPTFAANLVTAFGRLEGRPVGFIANQPLVMGGMIDAPACDKGAHFIALCDAFGLPLVHLIDVPGMSIGSAAERSLLGRRSAKLLVELGHATVPRLSVVLRKGYGLGYYAMSGGRSFDADACFAWPTAEICAMSIEGSVDVAFRRNYESAPDPAARRQQLIDDIRAKVGPLQAAEGFGLDDLIDPRTTRARLIEVLSRAPARRDLDMPPKVRSIAPI